MTAKPRPVTRESKTPRKRPAPHKTHAHAEPSGRVHLYVGISLDGFIAKPDGAVDWLDPYSDARAGFAPFIKTIGSAIMGRATYDQAVAHGYGDFGRMPAYVVTHRPFPPPSPLVVPVGGDLSGLVADIRQRYPGDIWLMGGGRLASAFLEADLIDIWSIAFMPTLLGSGLPMFPPAASPERRLVLIRNYTYPSGVVELRYERAAPARRRPR